MSDQLSKFEKIEYYITRLENWTCHYFKKSLTKIYLVNNLNSSALEFIQIIL